MRIPFDIKYRPQIESGEYKVETRNGLKVRIICWDRIAKKGTDDDLKLCVLIPEEEGEAVYYYYTNGQKWVKDARLDLFVVTPDQELTEFEQEVCAVSNLCLNFDMVEEVREASKKLIKMICEDQPIWHYAKAGTSLSGAALIRYEIDPDPRLGKVMVNDGHYLLVDELMDFGWESIKKK